MNKELMEEAKRHALHCVLVDRFSRFEDIQQINVEGIAKKINEAFDALDSKNRCNCDQTTGKECVAAPDANVDFIARIAHEVNRAYCQSLGDNSQLSWDDAPDWQKDSARNGVNFHLTGDHDPSESHESWMSQKLLEGWKYGPVKDPARREHPCMLPYAELPPEQRTKDFLFRAVIHACR